MIHRLHFSIEIKADKTKVWKALWSDQGYRDWASVFFKGSYAVTEEWQEGSTVLFLAPDQSGIYSRIEKHIPNALMQFKHIGNVANGKKQAIDAEAQKWSGATEKYTLSQATGNNTLAIEIDVLDEHVDFMTSTFPKALKKIKSNCR